MHLTTTAGSRWPARLAYAAAAFFSVASGGTNLIYGWTKGTDTATSLVWAAVSVGVSIVFALSWPAAIVSLDRKQWARALMVLVALVVTGTYSVSAALGSAMGGRANAAAAETATTGARQKNQAAYDAAQAELGTLKPSRSVAELEALVEAAKPQCRIIVLHGRQTVCTKPAALTAELGRAKRRAELEAKMATASAELVKTGPARIANSDAVALAAYLQGLGIETSADRINKLLVLLAVLVIECGGGLALAVGMALSDAGARSGAADIAGVNSVRSGINTVVHSVVDDPVDTHGSLPSHMADDRQQWGGRSARARVLQVLVERGGVLTGSQQAMSTAFGWSKSRMNAVLHDLKAVGLVRLSTGKSGTVVRLIEGGRA